MAGGLSENLTRVGNQGFRCLGARLLGMLAENGMGSLVRAGVRIMVLMAGSEPLGVCEALVDCVRVVGGEQVDGVGGWKRG